MPFEVLLAHIKKELIVYWNITALGTLYPFLQICQEFYLKFIVLELIALQYLVKLIECFLILIHPHLFDLNNISPDFTNL